MNTKRVLASVTTALLVLLAAEFCGEERPRAPLQEGPSTTVIVEPRNSKGEIDYAAALLREDPRNVALHLKDMWRTPEQVDCGAETIADVNRLLERIDSSSVLRVGFHRMRGGALHSLLSARVGQLLNILRCKCRTRETATAGDTRSELLRIAALLSTADDSVLYGLHARALRAATECPGTLGVQPWHLDTPEEFLTRSRLQAVAELIRRHKNLKAVDINIALRTLNQSFEAVLSGHPPTLVARPSGWQLVWMPFSDASKQVSIAAATPFIRLLADDLQIAKRSYAEGQTALLAMRKQDP